VSGPIGARAALAAFVAPLAPIPPLPPVPPISPVIGLPSPALCAHEESLERNAPAVLEAFEPWTRGAASSVAEVLVGARQVALATVVAAEGLLVSKASELGDEGCVCRFADGRLLAARIVARDPNFDVALLRVEASDLRPAPWSALAVTPGRLVVSAGPGGAPRALGIVGVAPARVTGGRARLGVVLAFDVQGAVVAQVRPGTPAALAGLCAGDRLVSIDGAEVSSRGEAVRRIHAREGGETLDLVVERGGRTLSLAPVLAARAPAPARSSWMEGEQSELRAGFPSVLQHDTVLDPRDCGGPLLGPGGAAVGLNIARAGRVTTYAIPAAEVVALVERLRERAEPAEDG